MKNIKIPLKLKAFILAIFASFSIILENGEYEISNIHKMLDSASYYVLIITIFIYIAFLWLIPRVKKENIKWGILFSIIASVFLLLCESYYKTNTWVNVFGSTMAIITSSIKGIGIACMAFFIFDLIAKVHIEVVDEKIQKKKIWKEFFKLVIIMFICWMPYMIFFAPGCMNADTKDQIGQVTGNEKICWTPNTIVREEGDPLLNNHHPVLHTLIIGCFIKIGSIFNSSFIGLEIYCIVQNILLIATITYMIIKLRQFGMSKRMARNLYLFFALFPLFPLWGMSIFKDIPFTIALVLCTIRLYELFKYPEKFKTKKYVELFVYTLLLMLLRNNGFYIIIPIIPCIFIYFRKNKNVLIKSVSVLLSAIILFKVVYTGFIFSAMGIKNGSMREMLSVPFQQTARYIKEHRNEITKNEEEAILKVLGNEKVSLDKIADKYVPERSDNVKSLYNKNVTNEELKKYFKVWLKMFLKHPETYVEAFLNLNYGWFCFDNIYDNIYYNGIRDEKITENINELKNPDIFINARTVIYEIVKVMDSIPIISCVLELSFYTWLYLIIFIIMLLRKKWAILVTTIPIYMNYLICFIGPVTYMRYAIPMVICVPFVLFMTFSDKRNKSTNIKENEIWMK